MKRSNLVCAVCVLSFVIVSGCNSTKKNAPAPASQAQPSQAQPAANAGQANLLFREVVETMNSGGYTYVSLENNGEDLGRHTGYGGQGWEQVACQPGMEMKNLREHSILRLRASSFQADLLRWCDLRKALASLAAEPLRFGQPLASPDASECWFVRISAVSI